MKPCYYDLYSKVHGTPETGFQMPNSPNLQYAAYTKALADKYLKKRSLCSYHKLENKVLFDGYTLTADDLDFSLSLTNEWYQLPDVPNMYVHYLSSDLFQVYFISPYFLFEQPASQYEYDQRAHYILHLPTDNSKITVLNESHLASSAIGPARGYNVGLTYVHFFGYGLQRFYEDLVFYKKEFPEKEFKSDMDLIHAVVAVRTANVLAVNPVNVVPLYYDEALTLVQERMSQAASKPVTK